jgi:hypothetical protein
MPTHKSVGSDYCEDLQDRREPAIKLDEEQAIVVGGPDSTARLTAKNNQLLSEDHILGFKPDLRLEGRNHDGEHKP